MTSVFQAEHRTMTAFILAVIVNSYNTGQVSVTPLPHPCRACLWVADAQLQALRFGGQRNCPECMSDETVSHPLSHPSPFALNLSQHQGLFQ